MKNNLLKIVLPAFAILLAVGLAFATEDKVVVMDAYYNIPGTENWEQTTVEDACYDGGSNACLHLGQQLYSAPRFDSTELSKP
ncbi:MAG TPA: DUF6520 family protein [Allomuricauda sp.]|uniref:Secreted protein n=1 Tax=Allomuricauda ruestringensis (strain DSM 13258 / CIP 107369 / LMG 19739 / B1) TaxID=886377 RepID=G2PQB1_ALLRU|nr:DUF6520 family protein [Allomuricauda ruestringensis]AEM71617.1 hypothetical protein Murru_2581 [Allomuricauda ruestringensis DSM 13258]HKL90225.1 DUF6520 family protein [Allomuricauda sp.]